MKTKTPPSSMEQIKTANLHTVFSLILDNQPISRAQITQLCDLTIVTVSNCADYLLERKVIVETGTGQSKRGRPPILMQVNERAGVLVGIFMEDAYGKLLVTDLNANRLEEHLLPCGSAEQERFFLLLEKKITELEERYASYPLGIIGVSLAHRGIFDHKRQAVISAIGHNVAWTTQEFAPRLQKAIKGYPLFTQSFRDAATLGNLYYYQIDKSEIFASIYCSMGMAVGIYLGQYGNDANPILSTWFAHTTINFNGRKCECGKRGCLVQYASPKALFHKLRPEEVYTKEGFDQILQAFHAQDPTVISAVHELTDYLAIGIVNLVNAYQPSTICISGLLASLIQDTQLNRIQAYVQNNSAFYPRQEKPRIFCSELEDWSIPYGGIYLIRNHLIEILQGELGPGSVSHF